MENPLKHPQHINPKPYHTISGGFLRGWEIYLNFRLALYFFDGENTVGFWDGEFVCVVQTAYYFYLFSVVACGAVFAIEDGDDGG